MSYMEARAEVPWKRYRHILGRRVGTAEMFFSSLYMVEQKEFMQRRSYNQKMTCVDNSFFNIFFVPKTPAARDPTYPAQKSRINTELILRNII